jgi:Mg2+/Co2+ transporter CorB
MLLGILAALLVITGIFSGTKSALMTLNRYRQQHQLRKKHRNAIKIMELLKQPDHLRVLLLCGGNIINILTVALTTVIAIRVGGDTAIAPAIVILTITLPIFADVTPKAVATIKAEKLAWLLAWIYTPLLKIFHPVARIVNFISRLFLRLFGIKSGKDKAEPVKADTRSQGNLSPNHYHDMLLSILNLESASVEDIMTHRNDIIGIDLEYPLETIIREIQHSPHTRLPVYKKNIDRVIGFVHLRTMLSQLNQPDFDKQNITENLKKPFFIPAGTSIQRQMQNFKAEKQRIGLVVDEYGDVLGLLTRDDLLQEIVGELVSEEPLIKIQEDGSQLVDAGITIRELNRFMQWSLPTEGPKTLNGLIIEYLETIPEPGISINLLGHPLKIIHCDENTVKLVKLPS